MTKDEKAMVKVQAGKVMDKIGPTGVAKIASAIEAQIKKYKAEKHMSKDGRQLVGLPARNIGVHQYLIEKYNIEPAVAYKVVEMIAEKSGKFCVGFSRFGSLLYLPQDYQGNSVVDFATLLK